MRRALLGRELKQRGCVLSHDAMTAAAAWAALEALAARFTPQTEADIKAAARAYAESLAEPLVAELGLILQYFERGEPYWYGYEPKRRITAALAEYKQRKKV